VPPALDWLRQLPLLPLLVMLLLLTMRSLPMRPPQPTLEKLLPRNSRYSLAAPVLPHATLALVQKQCKSALCHHCRPSLVMLLLLLLAPLPLLLAVLLLLLLLLLLLRRCRRRASNAWVGKLLRWPRLRPGHLGLPVVVPT